MSSPLKNNTNTIQNILNTINSISTKPAETYTPTDSDQIISGGVYLTGDQTITGDANLKAENIKSGVSIFGVDGSFEGGGTGGGDSAMLDAVLEGSAVEVTSNATSVAQRKFYFDATIETVDLPKATSIGEYAFQSCQKLTTVNLPSATSVEGEAFNNCTALTTVNLPSLTSLGKGAFQNCSSLTTVCFPGVTAINTNTFTRCSSLTMADFSVVTSIAQFAFYYCSALNALILRNTEQITALDSTNAFNNSRIKSGAAANSGRIYVPSALVEQYKAATNWSTYANQFRALEDYTVDGTTTGALDPSKI